MKVITPLDENEGALSKVCEHFGSAPFFAVSDTETGTIEIIVNGDSHHDHGQCTPADAFTGMGVDAVVCNGIGARAAARLQASGIDIYMAGFASTLEDALNRFKGGALKKVGLKQACEGHDCH
ncbi:MAG: NifB/NifX family molybdenum-iron cluster-binding protein [Prosthecochloris sp.]|uniref:Dinitrogenase iron-molybdenum cofactor biosynthesis protein n=1 Tax=Prosthecochloris aestuarii (strain DSM 271 / SK 413) TaxID=290512 RepID=B4S9A2_PROA2|nr:MULTISPECIES: NifB/NifX family molybdenum-iron cluster-binding protein [Prosthecochloris]ACF46572.1 Dinitrogenase iron-molybdenum cofactor biosynthesis protein [Prosthecochloris aestuarii DSM 271]MCW8798361.1 NifB/NifX family molybdenum-iron cluster-binding protein [Prosthecochloris sp.]RDD29883.1 dinitrogenase iron-molybdenum cofactor biosynthesis protein [Prosthecochloris sp. ZM]